ncbi:hypothetical protein HK099_008265 [Clydaea vesicula]|uniref:Acyl-CoA dehydrogenase n=1 Tax=Clydaea vesicula TaxID=447962 RepID=A0AAD5XT85_9FUNG|nr:hypothetical protein HK099_008265 [Clydaea vesicula]
MASGSQGFFQEPITFGNQFKEDLGLKKVLKKYLPKTVYSEIESDLIKFGDYVVCPKIMECVRLAEENPPKLTQFDNFGHRIDKLDLNEGWKFMKTVSAKEGLIAIGYERKQQEFSRLYQYAKLYLFSPSSAMYTCPLAMTDGAARLMEVSGTEKMKKRAYYHLTSTDPEQFWTSGQWMTERPGGSDVGNTETEAKHIQDKLYTIKGFKWFSSATDSEMTLLLARTVNNEGKFIEGSKGLSLFYGELFKNLDEKNEEKVLNGIRIQRLKNKFGTKSLPTAELELDGMKAEMVGNEGRGVAQISTLFNITRIHTALGVVSGTRRALVIAKNFSRKRRAFGKLIKDHPLHVINLAEQEVIFRACLNFTFFVIQKLGESEVLKTRESICLLRLLTPVVKSYTSKLCLNVISECMEALGGVGYIEETGIGKILRDTQVNTIWEGTTNVLGLDVIRVLTGRDGLECWNHYCEFVLKIIEKPQPKNSKIERKLFLNYNEILKSRFFTLKNFFEHYLFKKKDETLSKKKQNLNILELNSRKILFFFGKLTSLILLWENFLLSEKIDTDNSQEEFLDFNIFEKWLLSGVGESILVDGLEGCSIDYEIAMDSKL